MRVAVINCSKQHYNLGQHKLADWLRVQGHQVSCYQGDPGLFAYGHDLVCLSVVFSWHATSRCGSAPTARSGPAGRGCSRWAPGGGARRA